MRVADAKAGRQMGDDLGLAKLGREGLDVGNARWFTSHDADEDGARIQWHSKDAKPRFRHSTGPVEVILMPLIRIVCHSALVPRV